MAESLAILTSGDVSAHYLVPETAVAGQRVVFRLVPEAGRAWHAGTSYWQERSHLNDSSIGIEIVNLGYVEKQGQRHWLPFADYQIETVIELAKDIILRYQIIPTHVLGHSDIAPGRKIDPGPLFPWKKLADHGVGAWYDEAAIAEICEELAATICGQGQVDILWLQKNLKRYGYNVSESGVLDEKTATVIRAFQMHFRPSNYSGLPDLETCAILHNLINKYLEE